MSLTRRLLFNIVIGLILSPPPGAVADDKPAAPPVRRGDSGVLRGGPERTGQFPDARLPETPKVLWRVESDFTLHDAVYAAAAVFFGDDAGTAVACNAKDGEVLWQNEEDARGRRQVFAAPAVVGDRVFISSHKGVEALSRADGSSLWLFEIDHGADESSPLVVGNRVIVGGKDGRVYAVDAAKGEELWSRDIAEDAPEPPAGFEAEKNRSSDEPARPVSAASDGSTVFQSIFDQSRVVALDAGTGKPRWSYRAKGWVYMAPAVDAGLVLFGSQAKEVIALNKADGRLLWSTPTGVRVEAGAAVRDGSVFIGDCGGTFLRLDAKSGKVLWTFDATKDDGERKYIYSSPLLLGDSVVFGSGNGFVYALKADTGELVWKLRPVEDSDIVSTPTTDGRRLFVTTRRLGEAKGSHSLVAIGQDDEK